MLTHLTIKNYAIVSELELTYQNGLTIITGETGAGKSISFDALGYCLGARADSKVVRTGADRCDIIAEFDIRQLPAAQAWLQEHELASDDECILKRSISKEGSSRSYINGQPCPLQLTRQLAEHLVHIHGQHEQQSLMKRDSQRELLDAYADNQKLLDKVNHSFRHWQEAFNALQKLLDLQSQADRQELLSYQVNELDELALSKNETKTLEQEQTQLANAEQIIEDLEKLRSLLGASEENSAYDLLSQASILASGLKQQDNLQQAIELALIHLGEASEEVNDYAKNVEINPQRLNEVDSRLSHIYKLARKHRVKPEELLTTHKQLSLELASLADVENQRAELEAAIEKHAKEYFKNADKLSKSRAKAAKKLSLAVTEYCHQLGMPHGNFQVQLNKLENADPKLNGIESIDFLISTNPGQDCHLLSKVASGGEISRIALAIQVVTAQVRQAPTLLFDEVDVGIGGSTAATVGKLLNQLATHAQILCVTHQAQVASYANQHIRVSKQTDGQLTESCAESLGKDAQIEELARMLGGLKITEQTRAHAQEMLESAN